MHLPLATIAPGVGLSAAALRRQVDALYRAGDITLAYTKGPDGYLYDPEAVRRAVRDATLAEVEVAPEAVPALDRAARLERAADAHRAQRRRRKIEGNSAKANRRLARASRT